MNRMIRNYFLRNWGLKILALFLAFILWLSLIPEERTFSEKTVTVPLETLNIPSDVELVQKPEKTIDVTIRAPNSIIDSITSANVFAKLDLGKASVFQQEYPLNETMISIPQGGQVVRISPNKVRLKLERTNEMLLDVVPAIIGEPAEGRTVAKIELSPARVLVLGPESKLREKDKVTTSPINISGLGETSDFTADLILPRPELQLAASQTRVRVRVIIEERSAQSRAPGPPKKK
jgi:YbbR domain-containing protein